MRNGRQHQPDLFQPARRKNWPSLAVANLRHWALAVLLMLPASFAMGLGLGEIELESALNEKLKAEISLIDGSGLEPAEILVSLASADDFERVGVERFFFLTSLKFDVSVDSRGRPVIQVRSSQPISEPYLNFIVEVLWPSGRMLKEFTLLLDPPTFTQAAAPSVAAPSRETASTTAAGRVQREAEAAPAPRRAPVAAPSTARSGERSSRANDQPVRATGSDEWLTTRNDTLWQIAAKTLPADDVSVEQNMLAFKRKNPKAFMRNNINLLKAGYVLRTPSANESKELTLTQARAAVAQEHEAWRTGRSLPSGAEVASGSDRGDSSDGNDLRGQVDATEPQSTDTPTANADGQLRIIAGEGDSTQGAQDEVGTGSTAAADTAAGAEERDRMQRELEELNYKLDREAELAANQLVVKERQLEVKDQQIAELQATVKQMGEELNRQGSAEGQSQSTSTPAPWWQSPTALAVGLGSLALLLGWGLFSARKRSVAESDAYYDNAEPSMGMDTDTTGFATTDDLGEGLPLEAEESSIASVGGRAVDQVELDTAEADDDDPYLDLEDVALDNDGDDEDIGQTGDVIGEADIYIAYGRYPQAISLLQGALEADPDRHDVRCKLLQLYSETNDPDAFAEHFNELNDRCEDADILFAAKELQAAFSDEDFSTLAAGGATAVAGAGLAAAAAADDTVADAAELADDLGDDLDEALSEDDFDLELDDSELEVGLTDLNDDDHADAVQDELDSLDEMIGELDDMGSDSARDPDPVVSDSDATDASDATEQLGGDLGMDFDPEVDVAPELEASIDESELDAANHNDQDQESDFADDEFDFSEGADAATTKLDLARAYIDMGDEDGARDILSEVLAEGNDEQQRQANELLERI